jgi:DNA-binding transcriptional MocR family regulator
VARVQGRQQCGPGWVSHILQQLVLSLWTDAAVQAQIRAASSTYDARRRRLLRCLADRGVHASGASGLNVWIEVDDETGVVGALLQRGWVVAAGAPYRLAGAAPAIRVTIAALSESEAPKLAADLGDILAAVRAGRSG